MQRIIKTWSSTLMIVIFFATQNVASGTDDFVKVSLPKGVSIEIQKNWVMLSGNQRIALDSFVKSGLDLSGIEQENSELPFAANYYDKNNVLGVLNIRYYPQLELTQTDAQSANSLDIKELDFNIKKDIFNSANIYGYTVDSWQGTKKSEINGIITFITEYYRTLSNSSEKFRVRLVRVFADRKCFTLTVSYQTGEASFLMPMSNRIINSLSIEGIGGASTAKPPTSTGSSFRAYFPGEDGLMVLLLLSLLVTWGIGLVPPLLIRFVFMRRAIGRGWAIGVVAFFWVFNIVLFTILGSQSNQHPALALVAVSSYAILSREK